MYQSRRYPPTRRLGLRRSYMFRSTTISDGTIDEIELTPEQALDLGSGEAIAYLPRDEPGRR